MTYSDAEAKAVKDYYADRLDAMLAEAERCGVSNTAAIKHRVAMQQDWALSNRLAASAAAFADLQFWVQVEELETTDNLGILSYAVEHLETEPHQQAIAKNPNASSEVLAEVIRQGTVRTMTLVASNPNMTDDMLTGLLDTAHKIAGSLSGKPLNIWPEKSAADHKAEGAAELRKAVLSALESRKESVDAD